MADTMSPRKAKRRTHALGRRLQDLREKLGNISMAEAASRIGVTERTWLAWERNESEPSQSHHMLIDLLEQGKLPVK